MFKQIDKAFTNADSHQKYNQGGFIRGRRVAKKILRRGRRRVARGFERLALNLE